MPVILTRKVIRVIRVITFDIYSSSSFVACILTPSKVIRVIGVTRVIRVIIGGIRVTRVTKGYLSRHTSWTIKGMLREENIK